MSDVAAVVVRDAEMTKAEFPSGTLIVLLAVRVDGTSSTLNNPLVSVSFLITQPSGLHIGFPVPGKLPPMLKLVKEDEIKELVKIGVEF